MRTLERRVGVHGDDLGRGDHLEAARRRRAPRAGRRGRPGRRARRRPGGRRRRSRRAPVAAHGVDGDGQHTGRLATWPAISRRRWPGGRGTSRSAAHDVGQLGARRSGGRRCGRARRASTRRPGGCGSSPSRSSSWGRPSSILRGDAGRSRLASGGARVEPPPLSSITGRRARASSSRAAQRGSIDSVRQSHAPSFEVGAAGRAQAGAVLAAQRRERQREEHGVVTDQGSRSIGIALERVHVSPSSPSMPAGEHLDLERRSSSPSTGSGSAGTRPPRRPRRSRCTTIPSGIDSRIEVDADRRTVGHGRVADVDARRGPRTVTSAASARTAQELGDPIDEGAGTRRHQLWSWSKNACLVLRRRPRLVGVGARGSPVACPEPSPPGLAPSSDRALEDDLEAGSFWSQKSSPRGAGGGPRPRRLDDLAGPLLGGLAPPRCAAPSRSARARAARGCRRPRGRTLARNSSRSLSSQRAAAARRAGGRSPPRAARGPRPG